MIHVILMLTLMNGDVVQKQGVTAQSMSECRQIIKDWVLSMQDWEKNGGSKASTFITGCSLNVDGHPSKGL